MTEATLFVGGRVLTGRGSAEALLVEDGRVVATGPEPTVRAQAPTGADRIDLGGDLVVPGLADAHLHLGEIARGRSGFDATPPTNLVELLAALRAWSATHPGPAVVGRGLDLERLAERRWPTVAELDAAVDRPTVLFHASGHAAVLNTAARDRLGQVGTTPRQAVDPASVVVEEGLHELGPLVDAALPITSQGVEPVLRELATLGLTAVGSMNTSRAEVDALQELKAADRLSIRVRAYPPLARVREVPAPSAAASEALFAVPGVKGFLDGAFGPRTASLESPYADDPALRGIDRGTDERLEEDLQVAASRGLVPALHAIGDRAVVRAARLLSSPSVRAVRPRIEHASLTPPSTWSRLRASGATLVVQPGFLLTDLWLRDRLGAERARWAYGFRSLADHGLELAGSSDAPFDAPDPWKGLRAAVRRTDDTGRSANANPSEALPAPEALRLYTDGARRALGLSGGALEAGTPADLVVLRAADLSAAIRQGSAAVRSTWVAGRPVFRAAEKQTR